ncbi:MAG: mannose-1-phosphate guanylyltransferase/mannose-6-phosphate isomerase, partial [Mariprofundaceae bacterium]
MEEELACDVYVTILAGGSGTRFWPASREHLPKQFLKLGGHEQSLIESTMLRSTPVVAPERIMVVAKPDYRNETIRLLRPHGFSPSHYVEEPSARNTAPALGLAATKLHCMDPDGIMVVLPSDHMVHNIDAFSESIQAATDLAREGYLVTLGIKPHRAETGYGYIEAAGPLPSGGFRVQGFYEKPDMATAEGYVQQDHFFWNGGIFIWKAATFLQAIAKHMPDLAEGLAQIAAGWQACAEDEKKAYFSHASNYESIFNHFKSISVDYGIMEHAENIAMVPVDMGWSDLGSWESFWEFSGKDDAGNVISGNVMDIGSSNCLLRGNSRLLASIDMKDVAIVDTPDALLICPISSSQKVRAIVDELKQKGAEECIEHRTVERPWGYYTVLEEGPRYKTKKIGVNPGGRLSLQMHHHRSEHWIVLQGTA